LPEPAAVKIQTVGPKPHLSDPIPVFLAERLAWILRQTVEGEPLEIFPFLGCSRLSETIDRFKVSAVVHGHAHHGRYQGRTPRGTPVYNVAFPVEKSSGRPYALIKV